MIAIFVLYIHHKITEAEARVSGFSGQRIFGSADFPGWQAFF